MLRDAFLFYFCLYEVWLRPNGLWGWAEEPTFLVVFVKTALKFMEGTSKDNAVL